LAPNGRIQNGKIVAEGLAGGGGGGHHQVPPLPHQPQRLHLVGVEPVGAALFEGPRQTGMQRFGQRPVVGGAGRQHQLAGTLSGGWKQRMALAASVMHQPQLLLLDEPTAGVDPKARRDFWDEIHTLAADGLTVLVSTHYMDEAERCHRIVYISYGTIVARGTVPEVVAASGLHTMIVRGGDQAHLARALRNLPDVEEAAAFGADLHVVGPDRARLETAVARTIAGTGATARPGETSLEDVFIQLMNASTDNFGAALPPEERADPR